jgi:hypothetical protein
VFAAAGEARLVVDSSAEERAQSAAAVFMALASHWENESHTDLADLVSADGVRVAMGPVADREVTYSPRQAYYFFRNLFQTSETESFRYQRRQDEESSSQARSVVRWRYRRHGSERVEEVRLVVSLGYRDEGWKLTEIRAIR